MVVGKRISVVDTILEKVKEMILHGELIPGSKIPTETELCVRFGVGRNSLREAMKILSALGVMEIRQGDGTYLRTDPVLTTTDSIAYTMILKQSTPQQVFELREKLESNLLELAVKKASSEDILALQSIVDEHLQLIESERFDEIAEVDVRFHETIADIAKNPILHRMSQNVYDLFAASIGQTLKSQSEYIHSYEYHREMVDAIRWKNSQVVDQIVERSLEQWKKQMEIGVRDLIE